MRQIVLFVLCVNLAVCFGWTQPFSATQNLTIESYTPYTFNGPARLLSFEGSVRLTNASIFNLGPALVRTYSDGVYKNYTVSMPGVVYNGPYLRSNKYVFNKIVDPCITLVTSSSAIDFPEAWTNAQQGTFYLDEHYEILNTIELGWPWRYNHGDCNEDQTACVYYLLWQGPVNHTKLHLSVYAEDYIISDVIQSITFRQIGSRSCPQNGQTTTDDDYSFTIDFSTTRVIRRIVLLQDLPQNASFIISVTMNRKVVYIMPLLSLRKPSILPGDNTDFSDDFNIRPYWTYIVSASLSLLLLLASSIAIVVLKCRQRRALRAEYENIPGDEAVNNQQRDSEEQNISASS